MSKKDALGYYKVLEVAPDADGSEIKRQYYAMAKFWHPDHNEDSRAIEMFKKVSLAYDTLKDTKSRLQYDLLSLVYDENEFPTVGTLKIYKNQKDRDDKALRVLRQHKVKNGVITESKDICNIYEAGNMVLGTAINNWLSGWWGKNGIKTNISALLFNLNSVYANDNDNFKLLIHNAVAYDQEHNTEMAWIYAKQALFLAKYDEADLLNSYINTLDYHPPKKISIPAWNATELRRRQFLFPFLIVFTMAVLLIMLSLPQGILSSNKQTGYYETRIINGYEVPSDTIERKIMKTDSDEYSKEFLAHLTDDCTIYYGPDSRYSPMTQGKQGQTVRISGYTPDRSWYQVVIDNGEKGYVAKRFIEKGIGNEIPWRSHVYRGN